MDLNHDIFVQIKQKTKELSNNIKYLERTHGLEYNEK